MKGAHPSLRVATERWPIAGAFTISRGSKTEVEVVVAEVTDGVARGHGKCVPYGRYGETVDRVATTISSLAPQIARGLDRDELQRVLPRRALPATPSIARCGTSPPNAPAAPCMSSLACRRPPHG